MELNSDRILAILLMLVALLIGLGCTFATVAKMPREVKFANSCFVLVALILMFLAGKWGTQAETSVLGRFLVVGICFALIGASLVETIRWANYRNVPANAAAPQSQSDVIGGEPMTDSAKGGPKKIAKDKQPARNTTTKLAKNILTPNLEAEPPRAKTLGNDMSASITVTDEQGKPLPGAELLFVRENGTHSTMVVSDSQGRAVTGPSGQDGGVFCALNGFSSYYRTNHDHAKPTPIMLKREPKGGSIIITDGTGYIPGFSGRLNPILDSQGRTYLYAENVAIDGGKAQPVNFILNRPLLLEDSDGHRLEIRITEIVGASSLITYQRLGP